jgi:ABC-type Fe3+ transport system permease subunit
MATDNGRQWNTPTPPMPAQSPAQPRKPRRVFLWAFLAVQLIFLLWVLLGAQSGAGTPDDCGTLSREACNDADNAGTAIGVGIVIALWAAVDIILGITYAVYRLARRR